MFYCSLCWKETKVVLLNGKGQFYDQLNLKELKEPVTFQSQTVGLAHVQALFTVKKAEAHC